MGYLHIKDNQGKFPEFAAIQNALKLLRARRRDAFETLRTQKVCHQTAIRCFAESHQDRGSVEVYVSPLKQALPIAPIEP